MSLADQFTRRWASALIVACAVIVIATLALLVSPTLRRVTGFQPQERSVYAVGDLLDIPDVIDPDEPTVAVVGRAECGVCENSAPAFQALLAQVAKERRVRIRVIAQAPSNAAQLEFATALGAAGDQVVFTDLPLHRFRIVPTLLVIDRGGRVLFVREGALAGIERDLVARQVTSVLPN